MVPTDEESVTSTTPKVPGIPEGTYNPLSTLIISLVSFLVVFLTFFLLYFHFYQIGGQIKNWIRGSKDKDNLKSIPKKTLIETPPQPPPRTKRTRSFSEHNGNSRRESVA